MTIVIVKTKEGRYIATFGFPSRKKALEFTVDLYKENPELCWAMADTSQTEDI